MKNKTFKQSIKDATANPIQVARLAAKRRGMKAVGSLTADSVIVFGGMSNPELQGARKRTIMPDCPIAYAGKQFKVKTWRHDGADSWPVIVDVTVGEVDMSTPWATVEITTPDKTFHRMYHANFLGMV